MPSPRPVDADELAWVLRGADRLPAISSRTDPQAELASLLHVNAAMHRFAVEATRDASSTRVRVRALASALLASGNDALEYDARATLSAEEAFTQRRVNCLSFTVLFVALARDIGIPARFNEVDVPPSWDLGNEQTLLLYRHVDARVDGSGPIHDIVDISGDEFDPGYDQRLIPDTEAMAHFHNNRAVDLRLQGRLDEALQEALHALALAPDAEFLWTNLAGLYLATDAPAAARVAIRKALARDVASPLTFLVAAQIHERTGESALAERYRAASQDFMARSPYYHYQLATDALRRQHEHEAYAELRQAIDLYPRDHRFFFLMAVVLRRLGNPRLADDSLQVAYQLALDPLQRERYRNKFAELSRHG